MQISALVDGDDELLISLSTPVAGIAPASPELAPVLRVTARDCSLTRVRRWCDEGTVLRAYLSKDGAVMLADPVLGGNAACEPAAAVVQRRDQQAIPHDHSPSEDK